MEDTKKNQSEVVQTNEGLFMVEQFLHDNYLFRRNVLNGKVEYLNKPSGKADRAILPAEDGQAYRELSPEAEMSKAFPSLKMMAGLGIKLGLAMKRMGFEQSHSHNVAHYRVIQKSKPSMNREAA